jgi:FixJ family two-component response regulator
MTVRAMKAGAVDFLTKPIKREELLGAVRTALARDLHVQTSREQRNELRHPIQKINSARASCV